MKSKCSVYLFRLCCGFHTLQFQGSRLPMEKRFNQFVLHKNNVSREQLISFLTEQRKIKLTTLVLSVSLKYVSGLSLPINLKMRS